MATDEYTREEEPTVGMEFDSKQDTYNYYSEYARSKGFAVARRSQKTGDDGELRYFTLECSRGGKRQNKSNQPHVPRLSIKTDCKAKIRATLQNDKYVLTTVSLQHNHDLSPTKVRYFRCNKKIETHVKRKLELNDQVGISVSKNFNSLVVEAHGHENLSFTEKDARNYIEKARKLRLGVGDANAVQKYFTRMQENNSSFFYVIDFDDDSRIKKLFWADARSRIAYESFGDVVSFDTTYLTNKYDMPFAPFVGVNHHGQSILLGCGLLSNENIETFVWLFNSWLSCMSGRAPKAIITDQCKAMQHAIEIVFPEARHRWCLWHIMKKVPEKLRAYAEYEDISFALHNVVYDSISQVEFETDWKEMIDKFNLQGNEWLTGLYDEKHRWVPIFLKDTFWAGMSSTQRSESMNAFFYGYVTSKTTLKQFVEQYDNALKSKFEKEKMADFHSFNSAYECLSDFEIERKFQEVYTNAKFKEVQVEFKKILYCHPFHVKDEAFISTYQVCDDIKIGDEKWKRAKFEVCFNIMNCEAKCTCQLFEFRGIICCHSLSVLTLRQVRKIPDKYILARWRKDVKRDYIFLKVHYNEGNQPNTQWLDIMHKEFSEIVALGSKSDENRKRCLHDIQELKKFLICNEMHMKEKSNHVLVVSP